MRIAIRILQVALAVYLLLAVGLAIVYFRWVPGVDSLLSGREVHPFGYYLSYLSVLYGRFAVLIMLAVVAGYGLIAWVRATGGWRRFLPRFTFLILFTGLLAEITLRAIFLLPGGRLPSLQNPDLVADPSADDTYWVLSARLAGGADRDYVVPGRGWSQIRPEEGNPHGLRKEARTALEQAGPWIYFYGDSFVHGMPYNEKSLPALLNEHVDAFTFVNLGVRGYGVDQMFLKSREMGLPPAGGEVWVGILTWDLDRAYLEYTYGQKPRFRLIDNRLELAANPGDKNDQAYVDDFPIPFRSWLWQAVKRQYQKREGLERGGPERDEKIALNRAILGEWVNWCRDHAMPIRVVLFHTRQDLAQDSWRTRAVHAICTELDVPLFDTADILLPYIQAKGTWGEELYQPGDFHHTDLANQLIADGLAAWVGEPMADGR